MPLDVRAYIDANRGTADGRLAIGRRFLNGADGFPTSWKQAQLWLSSAAEGGSGEAAVDLGTAYSRGLAAKTDRSAAQAWFMKAGQLGDGDGYVGAANLATGFDETRAFLEKGVALGSVQAMLQLGSQLQEWEVMQAIIDKKNAPARSIILYRMAADRGAPDALAHIGDCYAKGECGLANNPAEAARWFRRAADRGSVLGQSLLAEAYARGEGVPKDIKQALGWFQRADCGNRIAPVAVARIYEKGLGGVPKDEAAAQRWYRKAAELGNEFAALKLAAYYDRRSWFNPAATAEARHWWQEAAAHGVSRFSLRALLIENFMFAGTGL